MWNSIDVNQTGEASAKQSLDGTDINACANMGGLLASVDDFGKVNLYTYPCNGTKAEKRVYHGHSSHVTNLTFVNSFAAYKLEVSKVCKLLFRLGSQRSK